MLKNEIKATRNKKLIFDSEKFKKSKLTIGILVVFMFIYLIYLIGNPKVFTRYDIYYSFMSTIPFTAIMALPLTLIVTLGKIDLSFPSVLAFSAWVYSYVFAVTHNLWLATLLCLLTGVIAGLLNAYLIESIRIPSIVATIGTMFFFRGLVNVCASGRGISLVGAKGTFLYNISVERIYGVVPAQAVWMLVLGIAFWFLFNRHKFGVYVSFVGDNRESARMMGINVNAVETICFIMMGFFSAFVAILSNLEVTYFWPSQGQGYLMTTLAAVFIGGTSVYGGKGTIFGSFIGALIIGTLEAGIIAIGLTGFWIELIYGLIIIIAVSIYARIMPKTT